MKTFDAGHLCGSLQNLASWQKVAELTFPPDQTVVLDDSIVVTAVRDAEYIVSEAATIAIPLTLDAASGFIQLIKETGDAVEDGPNKKGKAYTVSEMRQIRNKLHELLMMAPREISRQLVLTVPAQKATAYMVEKPFGAEVHAKFPSLTYDVGEASICIVVGRSTAAVFHVVRCLEAAISAMSRCLHIQDPTKPGDRTWGKTLGVLKDAIDVRWNKKDRSEGDGKLFDVAYAALAAMKNPFRDATMHLEKKYTEEEAEMLFLIVRNLLSSLAARLDENGEPNSFNL